MNQGYTIQETVRLTGVSAHTLRFYERIKLLGPIARDSSGHRCYSDVDLGWIKFVLLLRATGMALQEIAHFMRLEQTGEATLTKRLELLKTQRTTLLAHMAELQQCLTTLDNKIDFYEHANPVLCECLHPAEAINGIPTTGPHWDQSEHAMSGIDAVR